MSIRVPVCLFALACLPALMSRAAPLTPPLVGVWTPPSTSYIPYEINRMDNVLLLKAGTKLPISLKTPMDGKWTAEYGVIDEHGNYEAPPYLPAEGKDTITFTHGGSPAPVLKPGHPLPPPKPLPADYKMFTLTIRILPNPAIPGSGSTPYSVFIPLDAHGNGAKWKTIFPKAYPMPPARFLRTIVVPETGKKLDPPVEVTHIQSAMLNRSKDAYILPALNQTHNYTDGLQVRVKAVSFVPQRAKELPQLAGSPETDPDPRMDTRPDVREAIKKWQASQAKKTEF